MSNHHQNDNHDNNREITVETLSSPPLELKSAPLVKRASAAIIDSVIILAVWSLSTYTAGRGLPVTGPPSLDSFLIASLLGLTFMYYFITEGLFAATLGKFVLKIRVLGLDGDPCSLKSAFSRNLVRFIDWLPACYVLGTAVALTSSRRQRLGDRLGKTIVSPLPKKDINPPPAPFLFH